MANATNVQTAVKRAVSDVREGDLQALKQDVNVVMAQAQKVVGKELGKFRKAATGAADSVSKKAQSYPLASAGILFGAGALVGAALYAAARPAPSALEIVIRALKNTATQTRDSVWSGFQTARRAVR